MNTTPRHALARLIQQARTRNGWSQADLATHAGIGAKTVTNIETAAHPPRPASLTKLEEALGFIPGVLTDVLTHEHPENVTLEQITNPTDTAPAQDAATLTDADLIWELTQRLQTRTAENDRLRTENEQLRATPPADAFALAADTDRSGHGRHLSAVMDAAGEEDQT